MTAVVGPRSGEGFPCIFLPHLSIIVPFFALLLVDPEKMMIEETFETKHPDLKI
jgi:hypothetical protein